MTAPDPKTCAHCQRDLTGASIHTIQGIKVCADIRRCLAQQAKCEQQPAEATGGEGGPDDSFAMVAEGAPAGPARAVAEYWRDYATAVSDGGRFTDWTQIAQVAAWILTAMDAEVEQAQDGGNSEDGPALARILATLERHTARGSIGGEYLDADIRSILSGRMIWKTAAENASGERDALAARVAELTARPWIEIKPGRELTDDEVQALTDRFTMPAGRVVFLDADPAEES